MYFWSVKSHGEGWCFAYSSHIVSDAEQGPNQPPPSQDQALLLGCQGLALVGQEGTIREDFLEKTSTRGPR